MGGQHGIRRVMLGTAVVMIAVAAAVGSGSGVSAADQRIPDYPSRDAFENRCDSLGGDITLDGKGHVICELPDGSTVTCDTNAKNCTYRSAEILPSGGDGPVTGPLIISRPAVNTEPSVAAEDDDQADDQRKSKKGKHSNRGKQGSKGHK